MSREIFLSLFSLSIHKVSMATNYFKSNNTLTSAQALAVRQKAIQSGKNIAIIDPVVDYEWAKFNTNSGPKSYFDYYFSGQDIQVRIAEVPETDTEFGELPIMDLMFNIEQEKMPVYGFWDYTFAAVMRGTRLVTGTFTLATRYPDYMKNLLEKAAYNRSHGPTADSYPGRGLTEDDSNIDKYWGKNLDPAYLSGGNHIFSVHPPFSFVIIYGIQNISIPSSASDNRYRDFYQTTYQESESSLMADENHRLVESNPNYTNRFVIEAVELKSVQRQYVTDGSVCVETYSFFARDVLTPTAPSGNLSVSGGGSPRTAR